MSIVEVRQSGAGWFITLNRPDRLNALGEEVRVHVHEAVRELAERPDVPVVVLRGAGGSFSAGADIKERPIASPTWAGRRHAGGAWQRLLDDLEALPQVSVASLHGDVIGGAALLATACDLRVASPDLRLSIPEVGLGLPLTWAGLPRLVREIGLPRTRDLVLTGRIVSAEEALHWGLVQRIVDGDLDTAVTELVEELAAQPSGPLAMTRQALAAIGRDRGGFGVAWADPDLLAWATIDPEARKAFASYLERRDLR